MSCRTSVFAVLLSHADEVLKPSQKNCNEVHSTCTKTQKVTISSEGYFCCRGKKSLIFLYYILSLKLFSANYMSDLLFKL